MNKDYQDYQYRCHLLEGHTIDEENENGVKTLRFMADVNDHWVFLTPKEMHQLMMRCSPLGRIDASVAEIAKCMEAGLTMFVIDHTPTPPMFHLIGEGEPIAPHL